MLSYLLPRQPLLYFPFRKDGRNIWGLIILNLSLLLVRNSAITFPSCTEYKDAIGIRNKDFVSFFITLECRITTFIVVRGQRI